MEYFIIGLLVGLAIFVSFVIVIGWMMAKNKVERVGVLTFD